MAQSVKLSDGSYIDASAVYDTNAGKTQQDVNSSKLDKAGGTITGNVAINGALLSKAYNVSGITQGQIFPLPYVKFSAFGCSANDYPTYYQALIKWICAKYPNITNGMWIGVAYPGTNHMVLLGVYNTSETNSSGIPKYAWLTAFVFAGSMNKNYGYNEYTWYEKTFTVS